MDKELLKCLIDFYSKLESTDIKWKEIAKTTVKNIEILKDQTEALRHLTSPEVDNAELCKEGKYEGLREHLIFKMHAGIEYEVEAIRDALSRLNNNSQDLKQRLKKLEATRSKLSLEDENMKGLVNGTTYIPKLNLLLEWAIDACDYYHNLYLGIRDSLGAVDYKDASSIESLAESFLEGELKRMRIDRILAYTQFLAKMSCR